MPKHQPTELSQAELGIVGRSAAIEELLRLIRQIAPTDLTVLLIGESGAGKEVFAQAIHRLSNRASQRMIPINCGAIPETLLESELFGHERGAFTGAVDSRKGLFEAADGGTVFLDEIGEMSLATQVKLLRVLETLEFTRVGSTELRKTNVRVIAATNRDLAEDVRRGKFRADLYYRLHSAQLRIPPLRERVEDIPILIAWYATATARRVGASFNGSTGGALEVLVRYPWPGNVREPRNFVELLITLEGGTQITEEAVFRHLDIENRPPVIENPNAIVHLAGKTSEQVERELIYRALIELRNEVGELKELIRDNNRRVVEPASNFPALPPAPAPEPVPVDPIAELGHVNLAEVERRVILHAYQRHGFNKRRTAQALGISERTLFRKLQEYQMEGEGIKDTKMRDEG